MSMNEIKWVKMIDASTATDISLTGNQSSSAINSFQLTGQTSAGAGQADCGIEGSFDQVHWAFVLDVSLTLSTNDESIAGTVTGAFKYYRANLYGLTGTDATVTVYMGEVQ